MSHYFRKFAQASAKAMGNPWSFVLSIFSVILWAAFGPVFKYSDTWQLVINTATTVITFLMVFVIQNTQNRDTEALRLKLDELILATKRARNEFITVEDLDDELLSKLKEEMRSNAGKSRD